MALFETRVQFSAAFHPREAWKVEPEIFTFDSVPQPRRSPAIKARKPRRVLYPAQVRKYLPPQQTDSAKRWLIYLCLVVLLQIFTEEPAGEDLIAVQGHRPELNLALPSELSMEKIQNEIFSGHLGEEAFRGLEEEKRHNQSMTTPSYQEPLNSKPVQLVYVNSTLERLKAEGSSFGPGCSSVHIEVIVEQLNFWI
nr:PREDICTED: uncharacterized protein LOC106704514 [Latimeria chalumnae]|eukprot:XP_014347168.1 PREDICTED: uncharacterized protein LOC106704514 [Latimeria chalumnae]